MPGELLLSLLRVSKVDPTVLVRGRIARKWANGPNLKPNGKFRVSVEDGRQRDVSSGPRSLAEERFDTGEDCQTWGGGVQCAECSVSSGSSPSYTVAPGQKYIYSSDALMVLILKLDLSGNVLTSDGCYKVCGLRFKLLDMRTKHLKMTSSSEIVGCLLEEKNLTQKHSTNHKHFFKWQKNVFFMCIKPIFHKEITQSGETVHRNLEELGVIIFPKEDTTFCFIHL